MKTPLKYNKNGYLWFEMRYSENPVMIMKVEKCNKSFGKYVFRYMNASPLYVHTIEEVNAVLANIDFEPLQETDFD